MACIASIHRPLHVDMRNRGKAIIFVFAGFVTWMSAFSAATSKPMPPIVFKTPAVCPADAPTHWPIRMAVPPGRKMLCACHQQDHSEAIRRLIEMGRPGWLNARLIAQAACAPNSVLGIKPKCADFL